MANVASTFAKVWAAKKMYDYLSKDFSQLAVYRAGIIDANGKLLVKTKDLTPQQRRMWGPFERLMVYTKRVLKRHGVGSLALAMTFLESNQPDEFWLLAEMYDEDEDDDLVGILDDTVAANIAGTETPLGNKMVKRKEF